LGHPLHLHLQFSNELVKATESLGFQSPMPIQQKNKYLGLKRIIDFSPDILGLIFCRTRKDTQAVAELLMQDGYQAEAI
jgi:superfamily II DNA/RNA helicase